jgi:peroxiredoxin Q/BCP
MLLTAGIQAPDASVVNQDGRGLALSSLWQQGPLVLYFYPKDNTSGCTLESQEFTELKEAFGALNAQVVGVSKDSCKSHQKFIADQSLSLTLLSDEDGVLCEAYGVWQEKKNYGKTFMGIVRSTFIIDAQGVVRYAEYGVKSKGHAQAMLDVLKALS